MSDGQNVGKCDDEYCPHCYADYKPVGDGLPWHRRDEKCSEARAVEGATIGDDENVEEDVEE